MPSANILQGKIIHYSGGRVLKNGTVNGMPAEGFLKVKVSTARGAIPLQGAKVAVRGTTADDSGIIALLTTDQGLTPTIALPAPA